MDNTIIAIVVPNLPLHKSNIMLEMYANIYRTYEFRNIFCWNVSVQMKSAVIIDVELGHFSLPFVGNSEKKGREN